MDLDHTLVRNDTLHEQVARLVFGRPTLVPGLIRSLLHGKASVKAYCADNIVLDPDVLHACEEVLDFLAQQKAKGDYIVLCSAADKRVAQAIAQALGLFDEVIASEDGINLRGAAKARVLRDRFPQGFVYAGDHPADLEVWKHADGIVLVGTSPSTSAKARALGKPIVAEFRQHQLRPSRLKTWAKAARVHHWSKNVLIFVPVVLGHQWFNAELLKSVAIGFLLLLAVTSASYFINDLVDIDADRRHESKRNRPIASGALPLSQAMAFPTLVIPVALALGFLLDTTFGIVLSAYLAITMAYSFVFKRVPLFDTFVIALLFTARLIMGSALMGVALPVWLLTFSMFFFFSLAMAKRHTEIVRARMRGGDSIASRGYQVEDWPLTLAFGVSAALGSLIILVLYMVDEAFRTVGYSRPEFLWFVTFFVAVWVGRIWLLSHRGRMLDDPVSFALRDPASQGMAVACAACFLIAI